MHIRRPHRRGAVLVALVALLWGQPAAVGASEAPPAHGFVGAEVQPVSLEQGRALGLSGGAGVFVRDLLAWGPAYGAGIRRGDVLTAYDGVAVSGLAQVVALVQARKPGDRVSATVHRRGETLPVVVTLDAFPAGWGLETERMAVVPRLGLRLRALTPKAREEAAVRWGSTGLLEAAVAAGSPAARAGLQAGDLVVAADGVPLSDPSVADTALTAASLLLVEGVRGYRAVALDGRALPPPTAAAGASWQPLPDGSLMVLDVTHDSAAAAAGLRPGEVARRLGDAKGEAIAGRLSVRGLGGGEREIILAAEAPTLTEPQARPIPALKATVAALSPAVVSRFALRPSARGVVVTDTEPGGAAAVVGLRPGLVVVAVDQQPVTTPAEAAAALAAAERRGTAEAVLLIEGAQGFRILSLPLRGALATGGVPTPPPAPAVAPLLDWKPAAPVEQ
ncbi:PDZ domain-containing protein [Caenispirillum bisanense]|uniref:PDZ domain-containing protein n=1 Tax=Caenispirillum bisanense TaxID=414052 RepID=UPI0031E029DD